MKICIIIFLVMQLAVNSSVAGEMYQWIAEDGSVTFKDTPPPASKKRKKLKVYTDADFAPSPRPLHAGSGSTSHPEVSTPQPKGSAPKKERFTGNIEMYVTDWCPTCKMAEKYIADKNYPVVKYDIEKDKIANRRYQELGGHGVPLILVGSKRMSGFSAQLLEQYLGNE
jgi:glutaredoxin